MDTNKQIFNNLCKRDYIPLFFRSIYLDAVIEDGSWEVVIEDKDVWVYYLKKKWGLKYIITPKLVPYLGYWSFSDDFDLSRYQNLKKKLPSHHVLIDNLHPRYSQINHKKYTYFIKNQDPEVVFAKVSPKNRRYINKSISELTVSDQTDYEAFSTTVEKAFFAKNREVPYDMEVFSRLEKVLSLSNNRKIYSTLDETNKITGVLYLVYDEKTVYYLASAKLSKNNTMYALIWSAIKWAMKTGRNFDFEGSMIPSIERFFKGFGGEKIFYPYLYEPKNYFVDRLVKLKNPNVDL